MSARVTKLDDSQMSSNIAITEISRAHNAGIFNFATLISRNPFASYKKKANQPKRDFSGPNMLRAKEQKRAATIRKEQREERTTLTPKARSQSPVKINQFGSFPSGILKKSNSKFSLTNLNTLENDSLKKRATFQ
jgi:hypothetical protein